MLLPGHPSFRPGPPRAMSATGSRRMALAPPILGAMTEPGSMSQAMRPVFDRIAVRRAFARAGDGEPEFARIVQIARDGLLDGLDGIRIRPRRILDLGSGTGATARQLAHRFRRADIVSVDPVCALLHEARSRAPRWFSRHLHVTGEAERQPLSTDSMDLILSNLAMPWFDPIERAIAECLRILRPGGLMLLSTFGPDTLKELAYARAGSGASQRMHPFADMHVLGDALVRVGFTDVVMDVQRIRLHTPDFWRLCRVLCRSGGSSALAGRRRGLTARRPFNAAAARYETLRRPDGALPVSVELVFGHAWAPESAQAGPVGAIPRLDWSTEPESRP